jgi:hypothetical protein
MPVRQGSGIPQKTVGASLLAMTAAHPTFLWLTYRYRQQAGSHSFLRFDGQT